MSLEVQAGPGMLVAWEIVVVSGPAAGHGMALDGQGLVTLGRSPLARFRLDDRAISRFHCALVVATDGCRVRDLDSRHGTYVNGERVVRSRVLAPGDRLRVGRCEILFRRPERRTPAGETRIYPERSAAR